MRKTTKEILNRAVMENYAVAAVNVGNSLEVNAVIEAAEELNAPLILDVLPGNIQPCPQEFCSWILARCEKSHVPLALNMGDENSYNGALRAIQYGASSIMVNRSFLPFPENVAEMKQITAAAHAHSVSVEARLEESAAGNGTTSSDPAFLADALCLIRDAEVDCLAARVHTANSDAVMGIDFERLSILKKAVGNYPLVLHGALGIPPDQLQKACRAGLNKINLSKDLKTAAAQAVKNGGDGNIFELIKTGIKDKLLELIPLYGSADKGDCK